jgi:hypothetical protein
MTSRDANDRRYPSFLRSTEVGLNGSLLAIRCRKCLKVLPEPGTNPAGDPIFGIGDIRSTDYYPAARKYDRGAVGEYPDRPCITANLGR